MGDYFQRKGPVVNRDPDAQKARDFAKGMESGPSMSDAWNNIKRGVSSVFQTAPNNMDDGDKIAAMKRRQAQSGS